MCGTTCQTAAHAPANPWFSGGCIVSNALLLSRGCSQFVITHGQKHNNIDLSLLNNGDASVGSVLGLDSLLSLHKPWLQSVPPKWDSNSL